MEVLRYFTPAEASRNFPFHFVEGNGWRNVPDKVALVLMVCFHRTVCYKVC